MPHATNRRSRGRQGNNLIKSEPHSPIASPSPSDSGTVSLNINGRHPNNSSNSNHDGSSSYLPIDQSFYRYGRSDAPPPSERTTEPDPLLREVRMKRTSPASESPSPPGQPGLEESFFNTSFQGIGKKLKACNDTLGELQQLGIPSHDVQLPELVLVGDQSAGKSSLMSGLANLDLPRSEGTCTRCPLHIRVSRNNDWSCRVWLRKEYSYDPPEDRSIAEDDVTDRDPFFPWRKRSPPDISEFKTMHDIGEIEGVLRWAQIAILNDDKNHELFVPGSGSIALNTPIAQAAEDTTAKFSPNIIALEIKGPDLPDLSFYDMPGIFQNPADARDQYLVKVVQNLSKDYIKHPSAIIICSMPMNSDAENSSTFSLTRKLEASSRTIGVLTKADLIPENGNHDQWLSIMNGGTHRTGLGYFITSRPHGRNLEELKAWEDNIFETHATEKWPPVFHKFVDRCGIEKLKAFLSERLGEEFAKSLPTIKRKIKKRLDENTHKLNELPELPGNVECEVQTSLIEFVELARSKLKDTQKLKSLPSDFRECLLAMKPKFTLKDRDDETQVYEISDDESDAGSTITNNATPTSKRRSMHPPTTPAKRQRTTNPTANGSSLNGQIKPEEGRGSLPPTAAPQQRPRFPEPFTQFSNIGRGFRTVRQVREEIDAKTRVGMPDLIPEEVYTDLCREAVRPWDGPMKAFLNQIARLLHDVLGSALKRAFEKLHKRLIFQESKKHLKDYLDEHRKSTEEALAVVYRLETRGLFTINKVAFEHYREEELRQLRWYRHLMRSQAKGLAPQKSPPLWENLTKEQREQEETRQKAELAKLGADPFNKEVDVVAYVRGYYRLAALRFADSVALHIIHGMIPEIEKNLPYYLDSKLGLRGANAESVYERLMAEDERTATKREELKVEREKFVKALASIEALEAGARGNSFSEQDDSVTSVTMSGALGDHEV